MATAASLADVAVATIATRIVSAAVVGFVAGVLATALPVLPVRRSHRGC
jgi:hypothetical protein